MCPEKETLEEFKKKVIKAAKKLQGFHLWPNLINKEDMIEIKCTRVQVKRYKVQTMPARLQA